MTIATGRLGNAWALFTGTLPCLSTLPVVDDEQRSHHVALDALNSPVMQKVPLVGARFREAEKSRYALLFSMMCEYAWN